MSENKEKAKENKPLTIWARCENCGEIYIGKYENAKCEYCGCEKWKEFTFTFNYR